MSPCWWQLTEDTSPSCRVCFPAVRTMWSVCLASLSRRSLNTQGTSTKPVALRKSRQADSHSACLYSEPDWTTWTWSHLDYSSRTTIHCMLFHYHWDVVSCLHREWPAVFYNHMTSLLIYLLIISGLRLMSSPRRFQKSRQIWNQAEDYFGGVEEILQPTK